MNISIDKINFIAASENNKIFNLNILSNNTQINNITYISDIEENEEINRSNNKINSLNFTTLLNDNTKIIHNMYKIQDVYFKSAIYKTSKTVRTNTSLDFLNIYANTKYSTILNALTLNDTIYMFGTYSNSLFLDLNVDMNLFFILNNGMDKPDEKLISTYIYDKEKIIQMINENKFEENNAISVTLTNIQYNPLYEIPGNIQNNYLDGSIAVNTFKTKNQYDSLYNMNHDTIDNNNPILNHTRDYISLEKCNNLMYLKYYDNMYYDNTIARPLSGNCLNNKTYLHIELINAMNRIGNNIGHESNLYSIIIKTDILDNISKKNPKVAKILSYEIKNTVRSITQALAPAHTLLFDIYINLNSF